jgi:hypothetical protein
VTEGRSVSEKEKRFWRRVKQEYFQNSLEPTRDTIPAVRIAAQELPIHEQRAREFVRTWRNEGLVNTAPGDANYIRLTDAGVRHTFE